MPYGISGWWGIIFLDDDSLASSRMTWRRSPLSWTNTTVGAIIAGDYPDNSVVCHAHRLRGVT
jgi:hypothetical protein